MNTAVTETPTELRNVPAPAKLNVFLHIVGRRVDGYHLLQSVFMLIDWCDTLHFKRRADGNIHRIDALPGTILPEQDLVVRAAQALQAATSCSWGADITLEKHLPAEAGMGGGSSDAASTPQSLAIHGETQAVSTPGSLQRERLRAIASAISLSENHLEIAVFALTCSVSAPRPNTARPSTSSGRETLWMA